MKPYIPALIVVVLSTCGCQSLYSIAGRNDTLTKYENEVTVNLDDNPEYEYRDSHGVVQTAISLSLRDRFLAARTEAQESPGDAAKNRAYFDAGMAFSNGIANAWFNALSTEVRQHQYNLGLFNILMGATTSIYGLAHANATIVGASGAGQALVNAESRNYSAAFLLTPEVEALKEKLSAARADLRKSLESTTDFTNYSKTEEAVLAYDQTRTPTYVRDLLRKATDIAKFQVVDTDDLQKQAQIQGDLFRLANSLNQVTGRLSADDAKGIYLYLNAKDTDAAKAFEKQNPLLAKAVEDRQKNPTAVFEETMRDLQSFLDLPGYAAQVAAAELAAAKKKQSATKGVPAQNAAGENAGEGEEKIKALDAIIQRELPRSTPAKKTAPHIQVLGQ